MPIKFNLEDVLNYRLEFDTPIKAEVEVPVQVDNKEGEIQDDREFLETVIVPLKDEEDDKDKKEKKEVKLDKEDDDIDDTKKDDENDEEDKGKEDKEDDEEVPEFLATRPTFAEVSKKYPNFFKDFPDMKHVIGREMEYSKLFPTVDDAGEAKENSEAYQFLETQFARGDAKELLGTMKDADTNAYTKFVGEFLPSLAQSDTDSYFKIVSPVMHGLLNQVYTDAESTDENLKNAVLVLSKHLFKDPNVVTKPPVKTQLTTENKNNNNESESVKFRRERFNEAQTNVSNESLELIQESIYSEIASQFPDKKIPENLDEMIVDIIESGVRKINTDLKADESYMSMMNSLWGRAFKSSFTGDWKERIINAYLSRAKKLIPVVSRKIAPLIPKDRKTHEKRVTSSSPSSHNSNSKVPNAKVIDWNKTSDRDFLDGDIKTK